MISVIIVHYNTYQDTRECISSVLSSQGCEKEIIVVNNGDDDHPVEGLKAEFPDITIVGEGKNLGFSKGVNTGIQASKEEYICLLNSDCIMEENALVILKERMEKHPEIGAITGKILTNGTAQVCGQAFELREDLVDRLFHRRSGFDVKQEQFKACTQNETFFYPEWIWGTVFFFRKELLNEFPNGKLHDTYFLYMEDYQWCWHITRKLGKKVAYEPKAVFVHKNGKSSGINEAEKYRKYINPNHFDFLRKEFGWGYAQSYFFIRRLLKVKNMGFKKIYEFVNFFKPSVDSRA